MKINSSEILQVQKHISLSVFWNHFYFDLIFVTIDGKVKGDYKNGMSTSYLTYFNKTSDRVKKQHFKFFKEYIEKTFN